MKAKAGRQERIRLLGPPALPARAEGLRRASGPQAPRRGSVGLEEEAGGGLPAEGLARWLQAQVLLT